MLKKWNNFSLIIYLFYQIIMLVFFFFFFFFHFVGTTTIFADECGKVRPQVQVRG